MLSYNITLTTDYTRETFPAATLGEMLSLGYTIARAVDAVNGGPNPGWATLVVTGGDNRATLISVSNRDADGSLLAALRDTPLAREAQAATAARLRAEYDRRRAC